MDQGGSQLADEYRFFYGYEHANHHLWTDFIVRRESDWHLRG